MIRCGGCGEWFKNYQVTIVAEFMAGVYGPGYLCEKDLKQLDEDMKFLVERPED